MKRSGRLRTVLGLFALVTILAWPVLAQQGRAGGRPGGGGGQNGNGGGQNGNGNGNGNGGLSNLVPPGIDFILGYTPDNSLIVRDPPIEDSTPKVLVRAQWL